MRNLKLEIGNWGEMKRVYELDVCKPAEELSDMVWHDFDRWSIKVHLKKPNHGCENLSEEKFYRTAKFPISNCTKKEGGKKMEKIGVSTLRENLSIFLKKVEKGQVITITSRGHEMAKLVPVEDKMKESRKFLREPGKNAIIGDILSPIDETWQATK